MFYIGLLFANIFFVNSVIINYKIHKKTDEETFSENLQLHILIGIVFLSLAFFFIGSTLPGRIY